MAIIPKLALIPSGYKAGKIYSVLPTDGVGDFDFTRNLVATRINSSGLIETVATGIPRLNYPLIDGVVSGCPSYLLEDERLQVIQYSESFNNTYWNKASASIDSNLFISPDGTLNASKLVGISAYGSVFKFQAPVVSGVEYTCSIFAKKGNSSKVSLRAQSSGNDTRVVFDLDNLSTAISEGNDGGYQGAEIEVYPNGWYRCILTVTTASTQLTFNIYPNSPPNVSSQSSVYIYGAQLEQGTFKTSYIKSNSGTPTTRSAETAIGSGDSNTFNGSQGVLMAEISANSGSGIKAIAITDGTATNIITVRYFNSQIQGIYVNSANSTTYQINYNVSNVKNFTKVALSYQSGALKLYVNGTLIQNIALVVNDIPDWNTLQFNIGNSTQIFYGNVKQVQSFNEVLTDAELIALTTI